MAFADAAPLLFLAASPAWAGPGRILSPATGASLVAGESVNVVFAELPEEVREMELLLSVDGGRSYALRLTSRLEPRPASFTWSVPRIATPAARLRLRVGRNGEEVEAEPSGTFTISLPPVAEPAPFVFREGEWWVGSGSSCGLAERFLSEAPRARPWDLSDGPDGLLPEDDDYFQACLPAAPALASATSRRAARNSGPAPIGIVTLRSFPKRE